MEVRNDYTDDNGFTHIDVWQDDSDDSEGATVAIVCQDTGKWDFIDNRYRNDSAVLEAIEEVKQLRNIDGSFKEVLKKHQNELVTHMFQVVRLDDFFADEEDNYWIFETNDGKLVQSSCLIEWIPLKDYLPLDKYESLKTIWNLNAINKCE